MSEVFTMSLIPITRETLPLSLLGKGQGHKYDHGHALVLTGGSGRTGAARLAARAALRSGAGAVTLGVPPAAQFEVACQIAALMLTRVRDAEGLQHVLKDDRISAVCLGPGLGLEEKQAALIATAIQSGRPCVLDADALTLWAENAGAMPPLASHHVLTPHGGEFARLFPDIAASDASKSDQCRQAAQQSGAVVLYKGAQTVIAHPGGTVALHDASGPRAAPWLATAGAGDVLAGIITGLMARGIDPFRAAQLGAWLHVEAALDFGPGLIAEDLPEALPRVFARLEV